MNYIKNFIILFLITNTSSVIGQNVGMGVSNPLEDLHINGDFSAEKGNVSSGLFYRDSNSNKFPILTFNQMSSEINIGNHIGISLIGNVGINPISSSHKLSLSNTLLANGDIKIEQIFGGSIFGKTLFKVNSAELEFLDKWLVIDQNKRVHLGAQNYGSNVIVKKDVVFEDNISMASETPFEEIRKHTISADFPNVPSGTSKFYDFNVPGAQIGNMVTMTVSFDIPGSLIFSQAYVSAPNTVRVKMTNEGSNNQNLSSQNYHFIVIKI